MGAYKTTVSKQIHQAGLKTFQWQRSFHDHIIRDDVSFQRIADYINDNPAKWKDDTVSWQSFWVRNYFFCHFLLAALMRTLR